MRQVLEQIEGANATALARAVLLVPLLVCPRALDPAERAREPASAADGVEPDAQRGVAFELLLKELDVVRARGGTQQLQAGRLPRERRWSENFQN